MPKLLDEKTIRHELKESGLVKQVRTFYEVDSTNSYLKKEGFHQSLDGTLVVAETQYQGRGRFGRMWDSPAGLGLWFSLLLLPSDDRLDEIGWMRIGVEACHQAVCTSCRISLQIKWPNDLIFNERKAGGILTELNRHNRNIHRAIIGIGINVNQSPEDFAPSVRNRAVSLKMISGHEIDRLNLLVQIIRELEKVYLPSFK